MGLGFLDDSFFINGSEVNQWVLGGSSPKVKRPEREAGRLQLSTVELGYNVIKGTEYFVSL